MLKSGLVRHPVAIAGALLATVAAGVFGALLFAAFSGWLTNPYAGLVVFVGVPALFVLGLLLIPLGMWLQARQLRRHPDVALRRVAENHVCRIGRSRSSRSSCRRSGLRCLGGCAGLGGGRRCRLRHGPDE